MTSCHFQLFGRLNIVLDGVERTNDVSGGKSRLLLAYMVLAYGSPQSRKRIAFDFWPDSTDKQALSNLRKLLHDLRESVPQIDRYIRVTPGYLEWNREAAFHSDVREFERAAQGQTLYELREAEALYRGELLPGFYEEWLEERREWLARTYRSVLEKLVALLESRREYASAIDYANKLLERDKWREESYRTLMRLHALNRDKAGVAQTYGRLRDVWETELGIGPAEESARLFATLMENGGGDDAAGPDPAPFVGRNGEWGGLLDAWKQGANGGHVVLLKGESGIGKTRLALEFKAWVESQGGHTASAGCFPSTGALSYTPVVAWLRSLPLPPQLCPVARSELSRLLPDLLERYPDLPKPDPVRENWQLQRWFEAIRRMLLASQPMLLLLDDIQWTDGETLQLLSYLLRSDSKDALLVLATMRTDESAQDAVAPFFAGLRTGRKLTEIELAPLGEEETRRLMAATVGEALADRHAPGLYAQTGGVPLYIVETLREWQAGGARSECRPSPLAATVIENRLGRLEPDRRQLAIAIAAVGRPVSPGFMAAVTGADERTVLEAMEQLAQRKLIRENDCGDYDYTHAIVKETVYATVGASGRRFCHRQIANGLIAFHQDQPEAAAAEIAYHFELAGMKEEAIACYETAAEAAGNIRAYESTIGYYRKLCDLLPSGRLPPVLMKLGDAWMMAGNGKEAEQAYRQWFERFADSVSARERSVSDVALGDCLRQQGRYEEARLHLERALRHFEAAGDRSGLGLVYGALGMLDADIGDDDRAIERLTAKMRLADLAGRTRDDCRFYGVAAELHHIRCQYGRAMRVYKEQLGLAMEHRDQEAAGSALDGLALLYLDMDRMEPAFGLIAERIELSRSVRDRRGFAAAMGMLGKFYWAQGFCAQAEPCIAFCLEEAAALRDWRMAADMLVAEGGVRIAQQRYEEAELTLERSIRMAVRLRARRLECEALYWMSLAKQGRNRVEGAAEAAGEGLVIAERLKSRDRRVRLHVRLLLLETELGRIDSAGATDRLQRLLRANPGRREEAAIRYAMWKLDPGSSERRAAALALNEELGRKTGKTEYIDRCRELGGAVRPAAPRPLPAAAAEALEHRADPPRVLEEIDRECGFFV
ncbi:ATP-binding protein [Paenibacillus flagellatus]|uniref:ATP-binding protein n=1 Tax=Paenibacillus flagellatus TaxID=2211139 RepID=UPI0013051A5B|nr:AAA family ATPase [Paenibacillus flagellatus]